MVITLGPIFPMKKVRLREAIWHLQGVSARGRAGIWGRPLGFEALLLKPWRRGCASPEVDPAPSGPPTSSSLPLCLLALDLTFTQLAFASQASGSSRLLERGLCESLEVVFTESGSACRLSLLEGPPAALLFGSHLCFAPAGGLVRLRGRWQR